jgi:DNA-binding response OmpR family regulator
MGGMSGRDTLDPLTESPVDGPRLRVLVVDDEPSICQALTIALREGGYEVRSALSGDAALAIIRSEHVDLMLVDLRIPDMRGDVIFEVAAGLQPHLRAQSLFLTGDITERAETLIGHCRCNFLRKPFDLSDLLNGLRALSPRVQDASA